MQRSDACEIGQINKADWNAPKLARSEQAIYSVAKRPWVLR